MSAVVIIDSGGANIASLVYALRRLGCEAGLTRDPEVVRTASRVILPGVGAAADAMARLQRHGLAQLVPQLTQPVLGICLGMQLLFEASEEGGATCLGILPGTARRFQAAADRPVPHMGWNQLEVRDATALLRGVESGDYTYFVHSFALPVSAASAATCDYGGEFTAAVSRDNFHGTQFHPERSGRTGARILQNFLEAR
ncbi:MAG: imidazole glycerol phosphate synthase subunit HisH [Steroidobacteraceae bacterium]|nr:imidazole glycerol phosphate synthase subunit HisH [Steroidobacteraceae bacterium]